MTNLLTPSQAAEKLQITKEQLDGHVHDGTIHYVNVGRGKKKPRRRFSESEIEAFIVSRTNKQDDPCLFVKPASRHSRSRSASMATITDLAALRKALGIRSTKP